MKIHSVEPEDIDWRRVRRFVAFGAVVLILVASLLQVYSGLIVPICIALLLTYILLPLVDQLDRYRVPRVVVVSAILIITLSLLTLATIKVGPALYFEVLQLIRMLPQVYETAISQWLPPVKEFVVSLDMMGAAEFDQMVVETRGLVHMSERIQNAISTLWYTAPRVFGTMINVVMTPILTFFILKDYHLLKRRLMQVVPRDLLGPVDEFLVRVGETFGAVIKGQVTVAAILAGLYVVGLSGVGLQAAWAIGLIAGCCRVIPYLDIIVGGALSLVAVMSDFQGPGQLVAVASVFLVVQTIDGMFITPRVIGERVGLHPLIVIISVIAFGDWLGFWGVLLAIPTVAIAKVVWLSVRPFYVASVAYDIRNQYRSGKRLP